MPEWYHIPILILIWAGIYVVVALPIAYLGAYYLDEVWSIEGVCVMLINLIWFFISEVLSIEIMERWFD